VGERATFSFMVGGDRMNIDMCDIARMTIVYGDGSMVIMIRQPNGTMKVERRKR